VPNTYRVDMPPPPHSGSAMRWDSGMKNSIDGDVVLAVGPVAQAAGWDVRLRSAFLVKVYALLFTQMLITVAICGLCMKSQVCPQSLLVELSVSTLSVVTVRLCVSLLFLPTDHHRFGIGSLQRISVWLLWRVCVFSHRTYVCPQLPSAELRHVFRVYNIHGLASRYDNKFPRHMHHRFFSVNITFLYCHCCFYFRCRRCCCCWFFLLLLAFR
jgi:hypothetical protein